MHQNATAHELLVHFAAETKGDLVLISEQYRIKDPVSWHHDISGIAAMAAPSLEFLPKAEGTALSRFGV